MKKKQKIKLKFFIFTLIMIGIIAGAIILLLIDERVRKNTTNLNIDTEEKLGTETWTYLKKNYQNESYKFSLKYPSGWVITEKWDCSQNAFWTNFCVEISNSGFNLKLTVHEKDPTEDIPGRGVITQDDLNGSIRVKYNDGFLLRLKDLNGKDESGSEISEILFVEKLFDSPQDKYVAEYRNGLIIGNKFYTISYYAPIDSISTAEDLNNSNHVKIMDAILQSIVWEKGK